MGPYSVDAAKQFRVAALLPLKQLASEADVGVRNTANGLVEGK